MYGWATEWTELYTINYKPDRDVLAHNWLNLFNILD